MNWVVVANSNLCRIYHYDKSIEQIVLVKEVNHPVNKLKTREYFTSDKPGHYKTDSSAHGAYVPHTDPKEAEIDKFSREIAQELNQGRNTKAYSQLILITPPHITGLLSHHLDKHVKALIKKEIQKDILQYSQHELIAFLKDHLKLI